MKILKLFHPLWIMAICLLSSTISVAQQQDAQWPFYIAFEDATGARDTIWSLLDAAATYPASISGIFGEVPIQPDTVNFQVWFYHPVDYINGNPTDYYNTLLLNMNSDVVFGPEVYAANYELPLTVSWDTTLFTSNVLYEFGNNPVNFAHIDNEYLYFTYQEGNWDSEYGWDMTLTDHVELIPFDWGSQTHFPLSFYIKRGPLGPDVGLSKIPEVNFSISPNPATEYVKLNFTKVENGNIRIYDLHGKLVSHQSFSAQQEQISLNGLKSGLYFVEVQSADGTSVRKLIVNR